jgi:cytochrome P450
MGTQSSTAERRWVGPFATEAYTRNILAMFGNELQDIRQHVTESGRTLSEMQQDVLSQTPHARRPQLQESHTSRRKTD